MNKIPTANEVRANLRNAIRTLYERDRHLLVVGANERAITHRLAVYLEQIFDGWDVDCEYNRVGADPKRIDDFEDQLRCVNTNEDPSRDTYGKTVFPDIIVHKRDTPNNLLVVEAKKQSSRIPDELDRRKIVIYKESAHLQYRFGALVRLPVGDGELTPPEPDFL
jgi:hypothetical protein